jgi:hypothetical protein
MAAIAKPRASVVRAPLCERVALQLPLASELA